MENSSVIALACDHGGFELMGAVRSYLDSKGYAYKDFGTSSPGSCDYPEIMRPAAEAIISGGAGKGIFICGTGIGISIAANKIGGIRAALCTDVYMAEMARAHNDANVLALGGRVLSPEAAVLITDKFLNTDFSGEDKHRRRISMLGELDKRSVN